MPTKKPSATGKKSSTRKKPVAKKKAVAKKTTAKKRKGGNRYRRTKALDDSFFTLLAECGNVSLVTKNHAYSRTQAYKYRERYPEFAKRWEEAHAAYVEKLEAECDRRAVEGVTRGVFYQGIKVSEEQHYSDNLLMFRLKALAPDRYRERSEVKHEGQGLKIEIVDAPDSPH